MAEVDSLYSILNRRNLFDGSLDDFQTKLEDPSFRGNVYQILDRRNLISDTQEAFEQILLPQEEIVIPDVTTERIPIIQPDAPIGAEEITSIEPQTILPPEPRIQDLSQLGVEIPAEATVADVPTPILEVPQGIEDLTAQALEAEVPLEQAPADITQIPPVELPTYPHEAPPEYDTFFEENFARPINTFLSGVDKASATGFGMLDAWARKLSELTGGEGYSGIFKELSQLYAENYEKNKANGIKPDQGFVGDLATVIYETGGQLAVDLPILHQIGTLALPIWSAAQGGEGEIRAEQEFEAFLNGLREGDFRYLEDNEFITEEGIQPIIDAIERGDQNKQVNGFPLLKQTVDKYKTTEEVKGGSVLKGTAIGAAKGFALRGAIGTAAKLPKPIGAPLVGATFATPAIAEGDWPQAVSDILLGIGLSVGGKRQSFKQAGQDAKQALGLEKTTSLKLKPKEIEALRKVFNQPELAKQSDVAFVQSITKGGRKSPLFREIFGKEGSGELPVTVQSKVRAIYNRFMGKPVTEGLKVAEKKPTKKAEPKEPKALPKDKVSKPAPKKPIVAPKKKPTPKKPVVKEAKATPTEIVKRIKGQVENVESSKIVTEIEKSLTSRPEHTTGIVRKPITPQGKKMLRGIKKHSFRGNVGLRSIIEMVNKAVRTEIRKGSSQTSKKYPAHYQPKYHLIRAKSDRTQLILHEQGHGLYETIIDADPKALSEIKKDLEAIGEMDLSMASAHNTHEGFAEWVRRYVVNYGSIKDLKATPVIESYLSENQKPVWDVLQDAQLAYQELMAKSPVARREIMDNDVANPSLIDAVKDINAGLAHAVARGYAMERVDRRVYRAIVKGAKEMGMTHKDAQKMADKWRKDIAKGGSDILGIFQSTVLAPTEINNILEGYPFGQNGVRVIGEDGNYVQVGDESWREIKEKVGFKHWKAFDLYARSKAALSRYKEKGLDYQGVNDVLPPSELQDLVTDFEKNFPEYKKHFKDVNDFADDLAEVSVLSGERTRKEVNKMKDTYDAYVPLLSSEVGGSKVGTVPGEPSSKINYATGNLGGTIPLDDAIAKRTKDVIEAYYSNQSMMSLVKMVEKTQADPKIPFFARAEAGRVITKLKLDTKKMANLSEDEAKSIIAKHLEIAPKEVDLTWGGKAIWRGAKPNVTNVIAPFINGKRAYYQINDPLLYNLFAGSRNPSALVRYYDEIFTPITAPWKRVLTRNLLFTSRNLPRDAANAIVMGDGGESAVQFAYAWSGIMNKITGKRPTAKRTSELFSKGIEGAGTSAHKTRANAFTKTLMEGLEPIEDWKLMSWPQRLRSMPGLTSNILIKPIDFALALTGQTAVAEAGETATREGAAIQEIKAGGTDRSVNNAYAFISGNFGEKSGYADVSSILKPTGFVNPGLQILHRQILKATDPSSKDRKAFWLKLTIAVPANTAAIWAVKWLISDDEDKEREKERPTADRGAYVDVKGVRIPFDYGVIGVAQSLTWNYLDTQVADMTMYDIHTYALSVVKRIGDIPGSPMDYLPPLLRLREELKANRSFYFQKYIVPPMMENLDPEDQKFASTPKLYNDIGKVLRYSPIKLQYAFNSAGFQQVDEVIKLADRIDRGVPLKEKADYPFVGRLFIRNPKGWGSASVQEIGRRVDKKVSELKRKARDEHGFTFYKGDLNAYLKDVRASTKEGSFEREALDRQLLTHILYDDTQKEINRQNRAITKLRRKEQLSPDEYIQIEQLKEEMTRVAQQALLLDDDDIWNNTPKRDRKIKRWLNN